MDTSRKRKIVELRRIIRKKYNTLKKMEDDKIERIENIRSPITEPLKEIAEANENNEYLDKYNEKCIDYDNCYGPVYIDNKWLMGTKELEFTKHNIVLGDTKFNATPGLYELLFSKKPTNFTPKDHQLYKQILDITSAHLDSRGHLRHQADKLKFSTIIRPLFKNKTKSKSFKNAVERRRNMRDDRQNIKQIPGNTRRVKPIERLYEEDNKYIYRDDPNELCDRLKLFVASKNAGNTSVNNEIARIIDKLREADIIY
ncbi:unnamed protein product [Psylliodes chrysocephalus]|uniref:DUF8207 domain-containing protein n=1 Tax=Psylliodes chrysocephalus TaxID=3402493 RepID=A0A9P0G4J8_9CUCU|nr:unnamed protein product [Psylliodes chrysocephala]